MTLCGTSSSTALCASRMHPGDWLAANLSMQTETGSIQVETSPLPDLARGTARGQYGKQTVL